MERLFQSNVLLKNYCTYQVGGIVRYFFEPKTVEELKKAVLWAKKNGIPWFIVGNGSNLLVSDKGFDGLVIRTVSFFSNIQFNGLEAKADCGVTLEMFIEKCAEQGLMGLENLYDIPGSIGGAIFMNAGAFDSSISNCVLEVTSMDSDGVEYKRLQKDIMFSYRDSLYRHNNEIIISARFVFKKEEPLILLQRIKDIKLRRDQKQPPDRSKSCGSVFKRPANGFAGTLIEKAGLKGLRIGGAKVSEKHVNFIINHNNATALDVKQLIDEVRKRVHEYSGILLEPEVIMLGEF